MSNIENYMILMIYLTGFLALLAIAAFAADWLDKHFPGRRQNWPWD